MCLCFKATSNVQISSWPSLRVLVQVPRLWASPPWSRLSQSLRWPWRELNSHMVCSQCPNIYLLMLKGGVTVLAQTWPWHRPSFCQPSSSFCAPSSNMRSSWRKTLCLYAPIVAWPHYAPILPLPILRSSLTTITTLLLRLGMRRREYHLLPCWYYLNY